MSSYTSKDILLAAESYAQALHGAGKSADALAALREQSGELSALLEKSPEYGYFLESPQIATEAKHALTDKVFGDQLHELLKNLLGLLIDRERAILLPAILETFREILEREEGIYPADVTSARELGEDEKARVQAGLEKFSGAKLRIRYRVRPELIGGLVFRFKDVLVDGSVRADLRRLKDRFSGGEAA